MVNLVLGFELLEPIIQFFNNTVLMIVIDIMKIKFIQ
jgi:hypothetical protein